ncbi:MAG: FTR1 family protein [Actinomycetota bacterium]|nr:FTR1 family protein [Actinomycetota bacterium]
MLATLVIGLREGMEAALIVGIIAAFLKQDGKSKALRLMWTGVGLAVLLCIGIGIALAALSGALPQRQQEMLEAVIGLVAVAMVTWMVLWMRKHSKDLKRDLGTAVGGALANGTSFALVGMAFLAVVREGVETAVFLVAASQTAAGGATFSGAGLGIGVALVLGYLVYRGGVKLNLSKFFRITGVVLVVVAGGVLMSSLYHAYEAGWITIGRQAWLNFSAFIKPGSVQESLLTGVLGIRAELTAIDVLCWLLYVIPMLVVVVWPPRRPLARRTAGRVLTGLGVTAVIAAALLAGLVRGPAGTAGTRAFSLTGGSAPTAAGRLSVTLQRVADDQIVATLTGSVAAEGLPTAVTVDKDLTLPLSGADEMGGHSATTFSSAPISVTAPGTQTITASRLAELNGGRYPIGLRAADGSTALSVRNTAAITTTVVVDRASGSVLSVTLAVTPGMLAVQQGGQTYRVTLPLVNQVADQSTVPAAVVAATDRAAASSRAAVLGAVLPWLLGVWGVIVAGSGLLLLWRRPKTPMTTAPGAPGSVPAAELQQQNAARSEAPQALSATTSGA